MRHAERGTVRSTNQRRMWQSIRAAVAGPFQCVRLVVHTPCWTSSVLFSLAIAKAITARRKPERERQRERGRHKAEAATEKRFSENKLKIFGTWFDVWCPCTHTHSDLHMRVCVCVCARCLFCPLAFALISNCCCALPDSSSSGSGSSNNSHSSSISATDASVVLFVF